MRSSFTSIELLRLFIPGLYFGVVALLLLWAMTLVHHDVHITMAEVVLAFLFLSFTSGLTMYLRETPKRRRAFSENQPSQVVQNMARTMKGAQALSDDDARRLYFYLLNNHIPAPVHEKVFFFGAVYHIVVHVRRTTFWFAVLASLLFGYYMTLGYPLVELHGLMVLSIALWVVYILNVQYNKADRNMQENYQDQIVWLEMHRDVVEKVLRGWKR